MTQDSNYQDQGSLDQPQQPTEPQPGAYQAPGVVPPEQQQAAPELPEGTQQQVAGGGAPTPGPGEVQLPDGSIVPEGEATADRVREAQNTPAPAQPAPGGGATDPNAVDPNADADPNG